ncbi:MAG: hypothetical protein KIT44_04030 [Opitutaceae bacterium]|nr:hypothetical protein [Opitutaceae bacterium]
MRIFYHGAYQKSDVPSAAPIESSETEAKSIFARLSGEGSFLGILLRADHTLQLYRKSDGTLHAEVLNEPKRTIRYCTINVPLAELLIEAAFRGESLEQKIAFARVTWNDDHLQSA